MAKLNPLLWKRPRPLWSYGIAVLSVSVVLLLTFWPVTHLHESPATLFLCAVMVSAWFGGVRPGLLAVVTAIVVFDYFFVPPLYSFIPESREVPRLIAFVMSAIFVGLLSVAQRKATESLLETRDELRGTVQELKVTNQAVRKSEAYLAEAQRLSHTGSFGWRVATGQIAWSDETFQIFHVDPGTIVSVDHILQQVHPEDASAVKETIKRAAQDGKNFEHVYRLVMPDGFVKYVHVVAHASNDEGSGIEFIGAVMDITAEKQSEAALRNSEQQWRDVFENNPTMYFMVDAAGTVLAVNPFGAEQLGYTINELVGRPVLKVFHDGDSENAQTYLARCLKQLGRSMSWELRKVRKNGSMLWVRETARAVPRESGPVVLIACEDITDRKQAEEKIRQDEIELRQIIDLTPQHVAVLGPEMKTRLFASQTALNYYGITLEEWQRADANTFLHPDDLELATVADSHDFAGRQPYERELRLRRHDGKYRWFLFRFCPLLDEQGQITRWYVAAVDIDDRKQVEERLHLENVALREEIDSTSMFEEIVGSSPALQSVLSRVSKVAPTESTVLITGETGTGKELIARAIHRGSTRSARAFVSVNCAAIPRDLIASELFGHEKGAFTGATHRRLGRFELAAGGTIFLDEVGELPPETQISLLRVLQEHEFERVGGDRPIAADVRLLAATNRNMEEAILSGVFRSDLFYRLNVFPIEMPALRERKEDIRILVEYFIDRYASKNGKKIQSIDKRTIELLEAYGWPGNIRELQNVIERSVIVCESENFSVDESWLSRQQPVHADSASQPLAQKLSAQEKDMIEAALAETKGKVSGPLGAAAKLGIPQSTLDSKIRSLRINKHRFK